MNLIKIVIVFSIVFFQTTGTCEKLIVREIHNLNLQSEGSCCLDWHKNNALAIGGRNGTITIITETKNSNISQTNQSQSQSPWELCGIKNIPAHDNAIIIIKWNNTGKQIASASPDNVIKIWKLKKEDACNAMLTHKNTLVGIDWNPLPKFKNIIATASKHMVKIWNIKKTKKPLLKKHFDDEICSISWHPEGKFLIIGLYNNPNAMPPSIPIFKGKLIKGRLTLFNIYIDEVITAYSMKEICENKKDFVMRPSSLFFKNNETFLGTELGGNIKQYSFTDLTANKTFKKEDKSALAYNVAYNAMTDRTAAFCQEYSIHHGSPYYVNIMRFWQKNIFAGTYLLKTNAIPAMAFSPNGNYLAYVSANGKLHILETKEKE